MKVFYKLEVKDVVQLIADKYEIKDIEKIEAIGLGEYMVDMSDTEGRVNTPVKILKAETKQIAERQLEELRQLKEDNPVAVITPASTKDIQKEENDISEELKEKYERIKELMHSKYDDMTEEERYKECITDDKLMEWIHSGKTVVALCHDYGLGKNFRARIYKRVEKLRSECASSGDEEGRKEN